MQCLDGGIRVLGRLAAKATAGTMWLRVCVALLILSTTVLAMLYVGVLGLDDAFSVQNNQNVYYTNSSLAVASDVNSKMPNINESTTLLFPQLDASIGFHTVCLGGNCFPRSDLSGISPLVAMVAQVVINLRLPEPLALAYKEATRQYIFGFDIGAYCGASRTKILSLSNVGVAASAFALVLLLTLFTASMLLSLLVMDLRFLVDKATVDSEFHLVAVNVQAIPASYLIYKVNRHLQWVRPVLLSVFLLSLLVFSMSVLTMGATFALNRSTSKCGQSVCAAFEQSMANFYKLAESFRAKVSTPRAYSCSYGKSYLLVIAAFCFSGVCLFASGSLLLCYHRSKLHGQISAMRHHLRQMMGMKSVDGDGGNVNVQFPGASALMKTSSLMSFMTAASRASTGLVRSDSAYALSGPAGQRLRLCPAEDAQRHSRSVGDCIELYRRLKEFTAMEGQNRRDVMMEERVEFLACLALRETVWLGEELGRLHRFMLDRFLGPVLDMCLLETRTRQRLIRDYDAGITAVIASLGKGARRQEEKRALWEQCVRRCQEVQAQMRHNFQGTASYADAGSKPRRRMFSPVQPEQASCVELNIDEWVGRLEGLRATYVVESFSVDLFAELPLKTNLEHREANASNTCFST